MGLNVEETKIVPFASHMTFRCVCVCVRFFIVIVVGLFWFWVVVVVVVLFFCFLGGVCFVLFCFLLLF